MTEPEEKQDTGSERYVINHQIKSLLSNTLTLLSFVWRKEISFVERAGSVHRTRQLFETLTPELGDGSQDGTGNRRFSGVVQPGALSGERPRRPSFMSNAPVSTLLQRLLC